MKAPLLFATFLLLCLASALADGKRFQAQVPFRRPGLGLGGGKSTAVVIGIGDDKRVNTCAIVNAVSAVGAGFMQRPDDGFEAKQPYRTDYGKVPAATLVEYNQHNPDLALEAGPLYGVVYEISYDVRPEFILYEVKSTLSYTGSRSAQWYVYKKKYNDTFFSEKLLSGIDQHVAGCARPQ